MNNVRPAVVIDLDDTLVFTGRNYEVAKENFYRFMTRFGMTRSLCEQRLEEVNLTNHHATMIPIKQRFPISMYQLYKNWCYSHRVTFQEEMAEKAYEIGYEVYSMECPAIPGAHEVLDELFKTHDLYLYTHGHVDVQVNKIMRAGLDGYFRAVALPDRKTVSNLVRFMLTHDLSSQSTWVIGNSASQDILPALEVGIPASNCVLIDSYEWAGDRAEIPAGVHRVTELAQVPAILRQIVVPA